MCLRLKYCAGLGLSLLWMGIVILSQSLIMVSWDLMGILHPLLSDLLLSQMCLLGRSVVSMH